MSNVGWLVLQIIQKAHVWMNKNMIEVAAIQLARLKYSVGTFKRDLTVTVELFAIHFLFSLSS